ncbi:hypothetical protein ACIBH1_11190 [Nonomuraea sp. NPDC050663]|uniref:hypothetical protein n=1 Tax=Nonomuraea sp. NPDC050663 TaxID=3364370 RepID=UPI00378B4B0C
MIRRLFMHELRATTSLYYWARGLKHDARPGVTPFGYFRGQSSTLLVWLFAMTLEGVALYFLIPWPWLHQAMVVLHLYSVVLILGVIAACRTRTHLIGDGELRIRYGAAFDLRIPLHLVESARTDAKIHDGGVVTLADDRLDVVVSSQTNVTIRLSEPVTVTRPLGKTGTASLIRVHADDPKSFVRALSIPEPPARHGAKEVST